MPKTKAEGTRIYGASDDLVEIDGDINGEIGCFGTDEDDSDGVLVLIDDGTRLAVKYGKPGLGAVWGITVLEKGPLFDRVELCENEDADIYSDVVHLKPGAKSAIAATKWQRVK